MKELITILGILFLTSLMVNAQPPLSKKDQKRKAEFEAMIANEEKYEELMEVADQAFKEKKYVKARMTYEEAIDYNEEKKQWLISKVNDLDILMAKNIARAVDSIFIIPKVDAKKVGDDIVQEQTLEDRPVPEPMPAPEIALEEDKAPDQPKKEEAAVEEKEKPEEVIEEIAEVKPVVDPTPKPVKKSVPKEKPAPVKVKDDFVDLPQGITEEEFDYPDHHVWRIVVKDGIDTIVYKRVKHRWGGDFCFKDDVSISQRIWNEELEIFRKKYAPK